MEEKLQFLLPIDTGDEKEEIYEKIEAPKFVDFNLPDPYCPDDRYWFCLRVGCDQKHEEEMDYEAIDKSFVLRVMEARSPNVRLRKILNNRVTSGSKKCPASAPPKSSKSRIQRFAVVSSISQKLVFTKGQVRPPPPPKPSATTPKARVKHVAAKYMTTPRSNKCMANPKPFQSVRNLEKISATIPRNKMVAKALAFNSPPKPMKPKALAGLSSTPVTKLCEKIKKLETNSQNKGLAHRSSKEKLRNRQKVFNSPPKPTKLKAREGLSSTPVTKLCERIKKLEINSQKKGLAHRLSKEKSRNQQKVPLSDALGKQPFIHRVKIQHGNSCCREGSKRHEAKSSRSIKGKKKGDVQMPHKARASDSSAMDVENESRSSSLEVCLASAKSRDEAKAEGYEGDSAVVERLEFCLESVKSKNEEKVGGYEGDSAVVERLEFCLESVKSKNEEKVGGYEGDSAVVERLRSVGSSTGQMMEPLPNSQKNSEEHNGYEFQAPKAKGEKSQRESKQVENVDTNTPLGESDEDHLIENRSSVGAPHVDDKENAFSSNDTRDLNVGNAQLGRDASSKHDQAINTKVTRTPSRTLKENYASSVATQGGKYKKPKSTNPKPFRLRTDERGILKEATLERKFNLHETVTFSSENSQRGHGQEIQLDVKRMGHGRSENNNACKGIKKDPNGRINNDKLLCTRTTGQKAINRNVESKSDTLTPQKHAILAQKMVASSSSQLKDGKDRVAAHCTGDDDSRRTNSPFLPNKLVRPQRGVVAFSLKDAGRPSGIFEQADKASAVQRLALKGRKPATIPKDPPKYHSSLHISTTPKE
ncbi:hypothetical protein Nepgr_018256 [Nepenthes gracilis]|uniref:Uncharacterized protein n=1 Tax=Nepenthes gracilis TaxID=150966 RepID=A0AAD3SQZ2_NEPGR|nr:hypothetical protein Nepgr_018256 [Nepenthes gracilis]